MRLRNGETNCKSPAVHYFQVVCRSGDSENENREGEVAFPILLSGDDALGPHFNAIAGLQSASV